MKELLANWNSELQRQRFKYHLLSCSAFGRLLIGEREGGVVILPAGKSSGFECFAGEGHMHRGAGDASLRVELRSSGFGYIPVFGFRPGPAAMRGSGDVSQPEIDGIPHAVTGTPENLVAVLGRPERGLAHEALRKFGVEVSGKFGQSGFLFIPPVAVNKGVCWIERDGQVGNSFEGFRVEEFGRALDSILTDGDVRGLGLSAESRSIEDLIFRLRTSPTSFKEAKWRYGEVFFRFSEA